MSRQDVVAVQHVALQVTGGAVEVGRESQQESGVAVLHVKIDAAGIFEQKASEAFHVLQREAALLERA